MRKIIFFFFAFTFYVCENVVADSIVLDAKISRLEQRRDELKQKIEQCKQGVKKQKIAGGVAIGLAGVGVAANVKLYQKVSSIKSGGTGGTSGGASGLPQNNKSPQQAKDDSCALFLSEGLPLPPECN